MSILTCLKHRIQYIDECPICVAEEECAATMIMDMVSDMQDYVIRKENE